MSKVDLDRIEALAKEATLGPWEPYQNLSGTETYVYAPSGRYVVPWARESPVKVAWIPYPSSCERDTRDAAFIAALSPDVVLKLVAELKAAREVVEAADAFSMIRVGPTADNMHLSEAALEPLLFKLAGYRAAILHDDGAK